MALQGVGFLWLRAALLDRVATRLPGWRSVADIWNFLDYDQPDGADAARYEGGTPNILGALSLVTSMDVLAAAGIERIAAHVVALTDRLDDGLRTRGYAVVGARSRDERKSGFLSLTRQDVVADTIGMTPGVALICSQSRTN